MSDDFNAEHAEQEEHGAVSQDELVRAMYSRAKISPESKSLGSNLDREDAVDGAIISAPRSSTVHTSSKRKRFVSKLLGNR